MIIRKDLEKFVSVFDIQVRFCQWSLVLSNMYGTARRCRREAVTLSGNAESHDYSREGGYPRESGTAARQAGFASGAQADSLAPGPRLATLADEAWQAGLGGLGDDELIGLLRAARQLASRAAALELAVVADLAGRRRANPDRRDGLDPGEHVDAEVAAALTLTLAPPPGCLCNLGPASKS